MVRSTARAGKLKRSKARREPSGGEAETRAASVGELLAALDEGEANKAAATASGASAEPAGEAPLAGAAEPSPDDELGLQGFEDDASQDLPAAPAPEPQEPRGDGVELSDTLPMAPEDDLSRVRGQASPRLMSVVESLLFASTRPLTVRDIRKVLKEPTVRQVQLALRQLQHDTANRGVVLTQVAGGFRMRTNPTNARWVQKMLAGKPARLSRSQLEALAVVAYRQPITKAEVDHVRGVDCGAVLRVLLERDLARIVGRKEEPGRPHLYGTTVEFLEFFNLRSLRDMPDLHEFRELSDESRATLRDSLGDDVEEAESEVLGQGVLAFDGEEPGDDETSESAGADGAAVEGDGKADPTAEGVDAEEATGAEGQAADAESEIEADADGESAADADSESETEIEAAADRESGADADSESETEIEAAADGESGADGEPGADGESESESEAAADGESAAETNVDADADGESAADAEFEADIEADADAESETDVDADADTESETDVDVNVDADVDTESAVDADAEVPADALPDAESEPHNDTERRAASEPTTDAESDPDAESDAERTAGAEPAAVDPEPTPEPEDSQDVPTSADDESPEAQS